MRRLAVLAVLVALATLYLTGSLDRPLSTVGLNFHECARNGLGATFCGGELDRYRERAAHAREEGGRAKERIERAARAAAGEAAGRQREAAERANSERAERAKALEAKAARERTILETEPRGSVAYDVAAGEYEAVRAELQQIHAEGG